MTKQYEEIPITTLASGHGLVLPIHRVTGSQPGPTLGLTALMHGDEPLPNVIIRRLLTELDPVKLKGTVLMLPVANPLAYEALSRNTPLDMTNMNRSFPGSAGGLFTEQIAHTIVTRFVPQLDYLIDMHSGGTFPTVDYVYLSRVDPKISRVYGFDILYDGPGHQGSLSEVTESRNIPTVVAEIGGGSMLDDAYLELGLRGAYNVMKYVGMLAGEPEVPAQQIVIKELVTLRPRAGGMLYPEVGLDQLKQIVPGGTVLGRIISPYTFEELEVMTAPFARSLIVLLRAAVTRVNPGDYAFMIGNADVASSA